MSNILLNEVDVVSPKDFSVIRRIDIPQPVGIDQMPDGKTLVVGTETEGIFLINEDTYTVQSFFISTPSPRISILLPAIPVAMANGKVLFIALTPGRSPSAYYLEGDLYEWDPTTNSFTAPSPSIATWDMAVTVHIARSGDHKFAIFDRYGGGIYLYSSDADSFSSINNGLFSGDVAANSDGSQFAVSINGWVNFYDRNLNLLSTVNMPTASGGPNPLVAPYYGMQYSLDNSTVYIETTDVYVSPIVVIDAKQFAVKGLVPAYFSNRITPLYILAPGSSQSIYVAASGGVGVVDCSNQTSSVSLTAVSSVAIPDAVPLNKSSTVSWQSELPQGTKVTVGSKVATLGITSDSTMVTLPSFSVSGPADVSISLPDGSSYFFPQAVAYGTTASGLSQTLAPDNVSAPVTIYGFGIALQDPSSVTVGGKPASQIPDTVEGVSNLSLQSFQVLTPTASPGPPVDVKVSNANGTSDLQSALTYVHTTIVSADPGLSSLLYDSSRNLVYAVRTNGSQVSVFDPANLQWKSPIPIPGALSGAGYNYFTMTPDGSKLLLVDSNNAVFTVLDPDNPSTGKSISLHNASIPSAPIQVNFLTVTYVGAAGNDKALVVVGTTYAVIDLNTMNLTYAPDNTIPYTILFRNSLDRSQLVAGAAETSSGGISIWNPSAGTFKGQGYQQFFEDFAVSNDGKTSAVVAVDQLGTADFTDFIDDQLHFVGETQYPDLAPAQSRIVLGTEFSPQGTIFVVPRQNSIDFFDVATGHLRARYATAEPLISGANVADIKTDMTIDSQGKTLFLISVSGLTVVQFEQPLDSLPRTVWPYYKRKSARSVRQGS